MLESARVARLGLLDDADRPRVLPVTFAVAGSAIYSAVDSKPKRPGEPARVRYLRRRPEAALTVDHYADDWTQLAWVQVLGRVELLDPAEDKAFNKKEHLKALRDEHDGYESRNTKALDEFEERAMKTVQGD